MRCLLNGIYTMSGRIIQLNWGSLQWLLIMMPNRRTNVPLIVYNIQHLLNAWKWINSTFCWLCDRVKGSFATLPFHLRMYNGFSFGSSSDVTWTMYISCIPCIIQTFISRCPFHKRWTTLNSRNHFLSTCDNGCGM